jgi:hypothetical protein
MTNWYARPAVYSVRIKWTKKHLKEMVTPDTKSLGKIFSGARGPSHRFTPEPGPFAVREIRDCVKYHLYEAALNDGNLPRVEKDVLRFIIFRAGPDDTCYFGQDKAAKQLGYCRTRFSEAVTWLRDHKYISTTLKGKILNFDLSPWATLLSSGATDTCRQGRHRTKKPLTSYRTSTPSARISARELESLKAAWTGSGIPFIDYLKQRGYGG